MRSVSRGARLGVAEIKSVSDSLLLDLLELFPVTMYLCCGHPPRKARSARVARQIKSM